MKILAIRIKNLTSLEGNTEIDFTQEPLSTAGIFAITGTMGAGKSTILDALCLALYAKTPRYQQAEGGIEVKVINQNDVRGILRDGTTEGFAEVDFVGIDRQQYRATWSVRRARNRADGNLQPFEIKLKNLNTNTDVPGTKTELQLEIERLVGLNFEQFTRSVLLAQGDFTAFLKAAQKEKGALLEKLTGTQIYSTISMLIFERHREEALQLRDLNTQRGGIPTLTAEELGELAQQQQELTESIQTQEQRIAGLNLEISWYQQLLILQRQLEAAKVHYTNAIDAKSEAARRIAKLQQIEQAQPLRTAVENRRTTLQQLTDRETQLQQQQEALESLYAAQESHMQATQLADNILKDKIQAQEMAKPLLDRAKALDVQLTEKQKQIQQSGEELKEAKAKQQKLNATLATQQQSADAAAQEIARLTQWKTNNASRQALSEHESLILARLEDAVQTLKAEQQALQQLEDTIQHTGQLQISKEKFILEQAKIEKALQIVRLKYEATRTSLAAISLQGLEQEVTDTGTAVQQLTEATAHWQLLQTAQQELEHITTRVEAQKQELNRQRELLVPTKSELDNAGLQKDTAQQMLDKARLATAENVEELRDQLIPGDPCPVCGSLAHPYASENPQLHRVLTELEAAFRQQDQTHLKQLTLYNRLQEAIQKLMEDVAMLEKEHIRKREQVNTLHTPWEAFPIYTECIQVPPAERSSWLQTHLKQQKGRQQQLLQQLQSARKQQQLAETQHQECNRLEKLHTETVNQIKDMERNFLSLHEQHRQQSDEQQKAHDKLAAIQTELGSYFTAEGWFENWKVDPASFVTQITRFAATWRNNLQQLEQNQLNKREISATMSGLQQQLATLTEDSGQKQHQLDLLLQEYEELKADRTGLFDGKSIHEVEQILQKAINDASRRIEENRSRQDELLKTLTRTTTEKEQNEKHINSLQQQNIQLHGHIAQWLQAYNESHPDALTEDTLISLLDISADFIKTERTALRQLEDALTRTQTVLQERKTTLDHHLQQSQPEQTAEELQILLKEAKAGQEALASQQTEIQVRLRDDAVNKQRLGDLLQRIEAQVKLVDGWAKLNEVIGSADGKKFRQVAQEFTLDVLLGYANVHLDMLSRRYVLQRIPHTLGLQVADRDMGDEVRTVHSLSGGESFLVSLALALGLASLSSNRLQIESLFIDEGFGALDPNTLNIAMDALECLHHQGRKVGVISHVQEMTERIPVQIKVSKQQSGKSKVEVIEI